jgi:hypothetical protein
MKFDSLRRRIDALRPPEEAGDEGKAIFAAFAKHFPERLDELGLSDLVDEMQTALETVGPRPFGNSRPDDRPVWIVIEEVSNRHASLVYRIRAAEILADADALVDFGEPEDSEWIKRCQESAARDLEQEKKEQQTTCDQCGSDLAGWSCHSWTRDGRELKLCRNCAGCVSGKT